MHLLLVLWGFFAFCCWERGDSRCKHRGKGSQVPACLNTHAWPGSFLMLSAHEQSSFEDRRSDAPTSLGSLEQILLGDRNHLDKQAPFSSLELPWTALQFMPLPERWRGWATPGGGGFPWNGPRHVEFRMRGQTGRPERPAALVSACVLPCEKGGNGKDEEAEGPGCSVSRYSGTFGKAPSMPRTNLRPCRKWILLEKLSGPSVLQQGVPEWWECVKRESPGAVC